MNDYRLDLEYEGTRYSGWQIQDNARTVAGELQRAIGATGAKVVTLGGAGRTDAGVHALHQVAHLRLERAMDVERLRLAINDGLPPDIHGDPTTSMQPKKWQRQNVQRDLSKLYAQALEAVRSENWQVAIKTLEELSRKSADYKDAAQLLKNARKQEQLKELYAEATTLHVAQKWQAVVKVFEQLSVIDSTYPDPEGLLPSAQKEVAELKRLVDLNDLYSHAEREMDAGQWYEARRLLETVHKSQTEFLETEKLRKKVENEIAREEQKRKQNDQVNTLYEQAHGLLRSKKWRNSVGTLLARAEVEFKRWYLERQGGL